MKSPYERKIKDGAKPLLDDREEVLAAFVARPRGLTQAAAGSMHVGSAQQGNANAAGARAPSRAGEPDGAGAHPAAADHAQDSDRRSGSASAEP
jgi:hypothetical protein